MKSMFKKGMRLAMFASDGKGEMRFVQIVYVAKVYKGFVSITYSPNAPTVVTGFEIDKDSNVCRLNNSNSRLGFRSTEELRPVDEACERLEEFRSLRDKLISRASNVEFALKRTDIETLSNLVGPKELSYFLEIADALVKKLGDRY
jgi:hypothetical protein